MDRQDPRDDVAHGLRPVPSSLLLKVRDGMAPAEPRSKAEFAQEEPDLTDPGSCPVNRRKIELSYVPSAPTLLGPVAT